MERDLGEELGAGSKGVQVIELVFDEAVNGFDVARVGVSGGRNALRLTVAEGGGEAGTDAVVLDLAEEFAAIIGLPGQAAGSEGQERQAAADLAGRVPNGGQMAGLGWTSCIILLTKSLTGDKTVRHN